MDANTQWHHFPMILKNAVAKFTVDVRFEPDGVEAYSEGLKPKQMR